MCGICLWAILLRDILNLTLYNFSYPWHIHYIKSLLGMYSIFPLSLSLLLP